MLFRALIVSLGSTCEFDTTIISGSANCRLKWMFTEMSHEHTEVQTYS